VQPDEWWLRVQDIIDSLDRVSNYLSGMNSEMFEQDHRTRDAVVWNLAVIGEAARLVPVEIQEENPNIPWAKMRGMRNVLMHEYFGIDDGIVWETATRDLPRIRTILLQMIAGRSTDRRS
jgi:uncharacterized protein with HEPN domain